MTLYYLSEMIRRCKEAHKEAYIVLSTEEWGNVIQYISSFQVVPATQDRPAFFWYEDYMVLTPMSEWFLYRVKTITKSL